MTEDLELLRTDDEALGRMAAAAILASDTAIEASIYVLRCSYSQGDR